MHAHGSEIENVTWCRACVVTMTPRELLEAKIDNVISSVYFRCENRQTRIKRIAESIIPSDSVATRLTVGILFNKDSKWIGIHYSHKELRYCINVVPMLTIYIVKKDGIIP